MSSVGFGAGGINPLVSSTAGLAGQQRVANAGQQSADAAQQKFAVDQNALTTKAVGDVSDLSETDDRDADGRQPWSFQRRQQDASGQGRPPTPRVPDPDGERGGQLDFDA